jgi:hypothetical protein
VSDGVLTHREDAARGDEQQVDDARRRRTVVDCIQRLGVRRSAKSRSETGEWLALRRPSLKNEWELQLRLARYRTSGWERPGGASGEATTRGSDPVRS